MDSVIDGHRPIYKYLKNMGFQFWTYSDDNEHSMQHHPIQHVGRRAREGSSTELHEDLSSENALQNDVWYQQQACRATAAWLIASATDAATTTLAQVPSVRAFVAGVSREKQREARDEQHATHTSATSRVNRRMKAPPPLAERCPQRAPPIYVFNLRDGAPSARVAAGVAAASVAALAQGDVTSCHPAPQAPQDHLDSRPETR